MMGMNAQQMAMLQQAQQMQQMQAMGGQPTFPGGYPTAGMGGIPAGYPYSGLPAGVQQPYAQPTPNGATVATSGVKSIKLPDGVSVINVSIGEITCRGPGGSLISMRPPPPKPDFDKEESVKPTEYGPVKTGNCHKLAFKKTLGMSRWNKRKFIVDGHKVDWNLKDNKLIELKAGVILEKCDEHTPKRRDAHELATLSALSTPMFATHVGEVGKHHSIGIFVPADPFAGLEKLQEIGTKSPLQLMMNSGSAFDTPKDTTYYFHFDSDSERDEWYNLIAQNLQAHISQNHVPYQYFINLATQAGVVNAKSFNWREILISLYADF